MFHSKNGFHIINFIAEGIIPLYYKEILPAKHFKELTNNKKWRNPEFIDGRINYTQELERTSIFIREIIMRTMFMEVFAAFSNNKTIKCPWFLNGCGIGNSNCENFKTFNSYDEDKCVMLWYLGKYWNMKLENLKWII